MKYRYGDVIYRGHDKNEVERIIRECREMGFKLGDKPNYELPYEIGIVLNDDNYIDTRDRDRSRNRSRNRIRSRNRNWNWNWNRHDIENTFKIRILQYRNVFSSYSMKKVRQIIMTTGMTIFIHTRESSTAINNFALKAAKHFIIIHDPCPYDFCRSRGVGMAC